MLGLGVPGYELGVPVLHPPGATAVFPVILYFIERYFTTRKLRWLLGSSVAMAAQFYLGMFQHTIYADIFLAIYLISFGLHYKMKIAVMLRHGMIWG